MEKVWNPEETASKPFQSRLGARIPWRSPSHSWPCHAENAHLQFCTAAQSSIPQVFNYEKALTKSQEEKIINVFNPASPASC